ncbi:PASTA domain-containing protein [Actinocorallia populi]|uniref:PASTA domain-containing protein n=1 Tax=Actinocorallia populi TaxID=2079200 RepID=UPI000D0905DF|nr:PASTA domain-containing protein [Actinocorallia populi]
MDLAVGGRVPGYRDLREVGAGASGRVVMAVDGDGESLVAVKYLAEWLAGDARFREEFRKEAALLAGLESEHVVRVREYVETGGGAAVVMDLVDGVSLREVLAARGPLEPEAALAVWKGSLLGLSCAHEVGVMHRDHRPENILITAEGVTTLVDFGIVPRTGDRAETGGTPTYLPPERWRHGLVRPVGDVYAAAAVFFECLTGRPPYQAATVAELEELCVRAPIPVEEVPEAVRGLLRQGLAKDRRERAANGAELAAELEAVAEAAYGEDWERRGMRILAMAVAELAVLALSEKSADEAPGDEEPPEEEEKVVPVAVGAVRTKPSRKGLLPSSRIGKAVLVGVVLSLVACLAVLLTRSSGDAKDASLIVRPSTSALAAESVAGTVPDVVGAQQADAEKKVRAAALVPYVMFKQSLKHEPGTVIETDPAPGTDVGRDALVGLVIAQRSPVYAVTVPDVRGSSYAEAEAIIQNLGLTPRRVSREVSGEPGKVVSTSPDAGTEVERGSQVTIYVAKAPANASASVPNVTLLPQDRAAQAIREAGLKPVIVPQRNGTVPRGQVISTDPKAGAQITAGASVTLYVAQAPPVPDVTIPNVAGSSYEAAAQSLRNVGLVPEHAVRETTDAPEGTAVSTHPPAGTTVKPGAEVTVHIAQPPPLTLSAAASATPPVAYAYCRRGYTFVFSGSVSVSRGPVTVTYRWTRSDGASGPARTLRFPGTGPQTLPVERTFWRMDGRDYEGWERVEVLTPNPALSAPAAFAYDCRRTRR